MADPCYFEKKDVNAHLYGDSCECYFRTRDPVTGEDVFDQVSFDCLRKDASALVASCAKNAGYRTYGANVDDGDEVDPVLRRIAVRAFLVDANARVGLQLPSAIQGEAQALLDMLHRGELPLLCSDPDPEGAVGGVCFSKPQDECKPGKGYAGRRRATVFGNLKYEL